MMDNMFVTVSILYTEDDECLKKNHSGSYLRYRQRNRPILAIKKVISMIGAANGVFWLWKDKIFLIMDGIWMLF